MRVFEDAFALGELPGGAVGTIGNYDGVHRGQRAILDRVTAAARRAGCAAAVVTFEPHPLSVLRPDQPVERLATPEQKRRLLADAGIDLLFNVRFDEEFSRTSAEEFSRDFLIGRLALRELSVGRGFVFGRDREGDLALLSRLGAEAGMVVHGVDEVLHAGLPISSTRIRAAVRSGAVEEATELLGRPYAVVGEVVRGDGRGRTLGWPTANLELESDLLPADGVYATRVRFEGEAAARRSVTNVGTRPTFDGTSTRVLESHLFDFSEEIYGRRTEVELCRRLRAERRFESVADLVRQIARDAEAAVEYFRGQAC